MGPMLSNPSVDSAHLTRRVGLFSTTHRSQFVETSLAKIPSDLHDLIHRYWVGLRAHERPTLKETFRDGGPEQIPFLNDGWNGPPFSPDGIAIDVYGKYFVSNRLAHKIMVYSKEFQFLRSFGTPPSLQDAPEDGELNYPANIIFNLDDDLVVLDSTPRIQVFDPSSGQCLKTIRPVDLYRPVGIAVDTSGNYLVTDTHAHVIQIYSSEGTPLKTIGGRGSTAGDLYNPVGIGVDPSTGNIIVSESGNQRIQTFNEKGRLLGSFGKQFGHYNSIFAYPTGLFIDKTGKIIVCDQDNHRICIFTRDGKSLSTLGRTAKPRTNNPKKEAWTSYGEINAGLGERNEKMWKPFSVVLDASGTVFVGQPYKAGVYFD